MRGRFAISDSSESSISQNSPPVVQINLPGRRLELIPKTPTNQCRSARRDQTSPKSPKTPRNHHQPVIRQGTPRPRNTRAQLLGESSAKYRATEKKLTEAKNINHRYKVKLKEVLADRKLLMNQLKEIKDELRIERARNANSTFERTTMANHLDNIEIQRLKNANEVLDNENKDLKEKLALEIEKSDKLTLDFNAWRIQNIPISEHPLESTRIDPLKPTQRYLGSSSSEQTLHSGSSVGANQEHAANKQTKKLRQNEDHFERENDQLQKRIEDLQKQMQDIDKARSEDQRKIKKLEEKIIEIEEINAIEVENRRSMELELEIARKAFESRVPDKKSKDCCKTLLKRIEQQAVEINQQKSKRACQSCSKVKKKMKDMQSNYKLLKFKSYYMKKLHYMLRI